MEYWSGSIVDLGLRIVDFNYEFVMILIFSIRNLQSEIRNPLTPVLHDRKTQGL